MKQKFILLITFLLLALPWGAQAVKLYNPLGNVTTVEGFVNNFIRGLLGVVGAVALFYLVYGGFTWMMSGGNAEKIKSGKETIKWAIFGLAMIFFSYVVMSTVIKTLQGTA